MKRIIYVLIAMLSAYVVVFFLLRISGGLSVVMYATPGPRGDGSHYRLPSEVDRGSSSLMGNVVRFVCSPLIYIESRTFVSEEEEEEVRTRTEKGPRTEKGQSNP
jgi:hypothetical protein